MNVLLIVGVSAPCLCLRCSQDFRLQCYQTLTGLKFLIISSPNFSPVTLEKILQNV